MSSDRRWTSKFAMRIRSAVAWCIYAWMRALTLLPFRWQIALCKLLGRLAGPLLPGRRRIVQRNLEACFPELSAAQRKRLVGEHFAALGASIAETAMGWFGNPEDVRRRVRVEGAEHLVAALERGRGVILFGAHFTSIELFWPALRPLSARLCGMYKWQRNPVMNQVMYRGRGQYFDDMFASDNVRGMLRNLARNYVAWYASDQSHSGKNSALVPFFGVPAMTNTSISRIAHASGAVVLPYLCRRLDNGAEYVMTIRPPIPGFPSGDDARDARDLLRPLEEYIRLCPEQYWWIHKRFKGRPAPLPDIYTPARLTS
jgi:KDO2-lipid IV(A) lauroyltransferase